MKILLLAAALMNPPEGVIPDVTIYEDATVWTDDGLEKRDLIVSGGRFIASVPKGAAVSRVSLEGRYIVPAMANAHTHLTNASEGQSWEYLKDGVYYAWNPNLIQIPGWHEFMARSETYDVKTSWGGVTEPGGHPERLYVEQLRQWVYKDRARDSFLGDAYHYGRAEAEIVATLDLLTAQNADFVKMLLVHSDQYERRRDDDDFYGNKGLNPAMVPFLVAEAKKRGLPAYFHVETDYDLHVAAAAGAEFAGHLPAYLGWGPNRAISDDTIAAMKTVGMKAIPTYALAQGRYRPDEETGEVDEEARDSHYAQQAENLRKVVAAGIPLLTGTDAAFHLRDEMAHWIDIGGVDIATAMNAAFTTGRYLFPERMIQCFAPGCEADFLVLGRSPMEGVDALTSIELRIKAGELLEAPAGD